MSSHYGERCAADGMTGSRDINPEEYDVAGNELLLLSLLLLALDSKLLPSNESVQLIKSQILVIILNLASSTWIKISKIGDTNNRRL